MYDIKKIKKSSKGFRSNYFKPSKKQQANQARKKRASRPKSRGHKTFSRLARQLEEENKLNYKQDYKSLEKRLDIDRNQWGVEAVANKIVELITTKYKLLLAQNPNQDQQSLIQKIYTEGQTIIKKSFAEARETILPLPPEVNKLLTTTYNLSNQKLAAWKKKEFKQPLNPPLNTDCSIPPVKKKIAELFTKQGIYLKEARTKLPAINLKA